MNVAEVEEALLSLDRHDRAAVVQRGMRSLDADEFPEENQAEVDASWRAELRRRISSLESGEVTAVEMDDVHAQIRARLSALHQ